jgi:protein SCO1
MPRCVLLLVTVAAILATDGCRREPPARQFPLTGQVLSIAADGMEITIRHDEVKGFMPAMVMPFKVRDRALTTGRLPGDLVRATLQVSEEESWLSALEKTGWAPFPEKAESAEPVLELVKAGDAAPDATLIDQDKRAFRLSSLRGAPVLLTFIYTRCPLPDFCPRMDRQFQTVQQAVKEGRAPSDTRLVSVSFDPDFDTPDVLKAHAAAVGADPHTWTFATAPRPAIEQLGGRLGLSVIRDGDATSLTHNLRTAVIDRTGRLVTIFSGNEWTPAEAIAALGRR